MEKMKQGDARPAYGLEKEAVREEIQTGLQTGVEILAGNVEKGKETDHFHNTKYLLKQYRRVEYSIRISEADLNLRMEMQHGMRLSTLEVNSELAGIDLTGTKLENHARSVIRSKNMLEIINAALEAVREDPDRGDLLYQVLYITYFSKTKPRNRTQILIELDKLGYSMSAASYHNYLNAAIRAIDRILWGYTAKSTIYIVTLITTKSTMSALSKELFPLNKSLLSWNVWMKENTLSPIWWACRRNGLIPLIRRSIIRILSCRRIALRKRWSRKLSKFR
ncbi:MAG: hypothetical protein SPJ87_06880 [Oscillospiraceae bacterium]|nr:hypothetical protein [Oscillospiraceae bacterium]